MRERELGGGDGMMKVSRFPNVGKYAPFIKSKMFSVNQNSFALFSTIFLIKLDTKFYQTFIDLS